MSDMGEDFKAMREASQVKRAGNRTNSALILTENGIGFVSKNGGDHLIIEAGDVKIDFWPGTGLWIQRGTNARQRGVAHLVRFVRVISASNSGAGL